MTQQRDRGAAQQQGAHPGGRVGEAEVGPQFMEWAELADPLYVVGRLCISGFALNMDINGLMLNLTLLHLTPTRSPPADTPVTVVETPSEMEPLVWLSEITRLGLTWVCLTPSPKITHLPATECARWCPAQLLCGHAADLEGAGWPCGQQGFQLWLHCLSACGLGQVTFSLCPRTFAVPEVSSCQSPGSPEWTCWVGKWRGRSFLRLTLL